MNSEIHIKWLLPGYVILLLVGAVVLAGLPWVPIAANAASEVTEVSTTWPEDSYIIEKKGMMVSAIESQTGRTVDSRADAADVIQGRLDALPPSGGRIFLRLGTYVLSHGLKVRSSRTVIEGEGYFNTRLRLGDNVNDNVIEFMPRVNLSQDEIVTKRKWNAVLSYVACRNFTVDGNRKHNTKGSGIIGPLTRSIFTDLHVLNIAEDGLCFPWGGTGHKLTRLVVEKCGRNGIHMGITDSWITDCTIAMTEGSGIAVYAGATKIHHAHVWLCGIGIQAGIEKYGSGSVWVYDSYIESNLQEGIKFGPRNVYRGLIEGCTFMKNSLGKAYTWSDISGVVEKPYRISDLIIRGNIFFGASNTEKGNTLHNICLGPESRDNIITDNVFSKTCKGSPVVQPGGTNRVDGNVNFRTENSGAVVLLAGQTSVDVFHGLVEAPLIANLTPTSDTAGKRFWVGTKDANTFSLCIDSLAIRDISFDWTATLGNKPTGEVSAAQAKDPVKKQ
nr:right-handed parallel beta-helix repeat-containing protein [uncultured Desulfobacter sp.]